jgi:uncharacterized membrane protein (DUF2068 family)
MNPARPASRTLRGIAVVETVKGLIVIAAGFGALRLLRHDARQVAVALVTRLHIDPQGREAGLFVELAGHLTSARLWALAAMALVYAVVRFVEGYGLWLGRRWAAWVGAIGSGLYVPVEGYELWRHPSVEKGLVLVFNVAVVAFLVAQLRPRARPAVIGTGSSRTAGS